MGNHTGMSSNVADFVVYKVLDAFEYTDRGAIVTMVDSQGRSVRLHITTITGELLCEHIAEALEQRYGK